MNDMNGNSVVGSPVSSTTNIPVSSTTNIPVRSEENIKVLGTVSGGIKPETIDKLDDELSIMFQWGKYYNVPLSFLYIDNPKRLELYELTTNNIKDINSVFNYEIVDNKIIYNLVISSPIAVMIINNRIDDKLKGDIENLLKSEQSFLKTLDTLSEIFKTFPQQILDDIKIEAVDVPVGYYLLKNNIPIIELLGNNFSDDFNSVFLGRLSEIVIKNKNIGEEIIGYIQGGENLTLNDIIVNVAKKNNINIGSVIEAIENIKFDIDITGEFEQLLETNSRILQDNNIVYFLNKLGDFNMLLSMAVESNKNKILKYFASYLYKLYYTGSHINNEILELANAILRSDSKPVYSSLESFNNNRKGWVDEYNKEKEHVENVTSKILELREILISSGELEHTALNVNRITLNGNPKWNITNDMSKDSRNNKSLIEEDGLDLINNTVASFEVPYIKYNKGPDNNEGNYRGHELADQKPTIGVNLSLFSSTKSDPSKIVKNEGIERVITKVYSPDSSSVSPNYDNIIRDESKSNKPDTVYMTVWSGTGSDNEKERLSKDSYVMVDYYMSLNLIQLSLPIKQFDTDQIVIDRIYESLPIRVDKWNETKVNGKFDIYNLNINEISLLHNITNDYVIKNYLYIEESEKASAGKTRLYLHYRSPSEVIGGIELSTTIRLTYTQHITDDKSSHYVTFNLFDVPSRREADRIISLISRLFAYYTNKVNGLSIQDETDLLYENLIPELKEEDTEEGGIVSDNFYIQEELRKQRSDKKSKIYLLEKAAPDIFVSGYATVCQFNEQPIPININEIDRWVNKTFVRGNEHKKRQVISYPPGNPKVHLVCPDDKIPYPGLRENTGINAVKYPYIPCCYNTDHVKNPGSKYTAYYSGKPIKPKTAKALQYEQVKIKILGAGKTGPVPENISKYLSLYEDIDDYKRIGVDATPNSMIHCVLVATRYPGYIEAKSSEERENVAKLMRSIIAKNTPPQLLAQENNDKSMGEIIKDLENNNTFFDPALYYRAVEEAFNINIFVFVSKTEGSNNKDQIEIPRHKKFYVKRAVLERDTIIIYKHQKYKQRRGVFVESQCELIIRKLKGVNFYNPIYTGNVSPQVIEAMHELFYQTANIVEWTFEKGDDLIARNGLIFSDFTNFPRLIRDNQKPEDTIQGELKSFEFTHQLLDDYGKTTGLKVTTTDNGKRITMLIIIPPSQPLSLPLWEGSKDVIPELDDVIAILGRGITGVTYKNMNSKVIDGIWYSAYNIKYGIYIPIVPIKSEQNFQEGVSIPINILKTNEKSVVNRIRILRKTNKIILTLLQITFDLWSNSHPLEKVDTFINEYLIMGEANNVDSYNIYDIRNVPYHLKEIRDVTQFINFISKITGNLIHDGKFYIYSSKYYNGIVFFLRGYDKDIPLGKRNVKYIVPSTLSEEDDFIQRSNNLIFLRTEDMKRWLSSILNKRSTNSIIKSTISRESAKLTYPYLFLWITDQSNITYIIQNVNYSDKSYKQQGDRKRRRRKPIKATFLSDVSSSTSGNTQLELVPSKNERTSKNIIKPGGMAYIPELGPTEEDIRNKREELAKDVSLSRAINVAKNWRDNTYNLGYYSPKLEKPYPPYIIYTISSSQIPVLSDDHSQNNSNPLNILYYGDSKYAAMLHL